MSRRAVGLALLDLAVVEQVPRSRIRGLARDEPRIPPHQRAGISKLRQRNIGALSDAKQRKLAVSGGWPAGYLGQRGRHRQMSQPQPFRSVRPQGFPHGVPHERRAIGDLGRRMVIRRIGEQHEPAAKRRAVGLVGQAQLRAHADSSQQSEQPD